MKKTKTFLTVAVSLVVTAMGLHAQEKTVDRPQRPTPEQMIEHKVQRAVIELSLDDKTSKEFVVLYREYLTQKMELRKEMRKQMPAKPSGNVGNPAQPKVMTDAQAAAKVEKSMSVRQDTITMNQKLLDLDKTYMGKFEKILNPKQMKKLYDMNTQRPPHHSKGKAGHPSGRKPSFNGQAPVGK